MNEIITMFEEKIKKIESFIIKDIDTSVIRECNEYFKGYIRGLESAIKVINEKK